MFVATQRYEMFSYSVKIFHVLAFRFLNILYFMTETQSDYVKQIVKNKICHNLLTLMSVQTRMTFFPSFLNMKEALFPIKREHTVDVNLQKGLKAT